MNFVFKMTVFRLKKVSINYFLVSNSCQIDRSDFTLPMKRDAPAKKA